MGLTNQLVAKLTWFYQQKLGFYDEIPIIYLNIYIYINVYTRTYTHIYNIYIYTHGQTWIIIHISEWMIDIDLTVKWWLERGYYSARYINQLLPACHPAKSPNSSVRQNRVIELDGTKRCPIDHGPTSAGHFLYDVAAAVRRHFFEVEPDPGGWGVRKGDEPPNRY